MDTEKQNHVTVRILEGAALMHEDRAYHAGHELDVSEADAKSLEEAGTAERVDRRGRRRRRAPAG